MKFNYQARTKKGEIQSGIVEASTKEAAYTVLKSHDLFVTALEEVALPFYAKRLKVLEIISQKDLVLFSRQLAIMFKSNVPVVETFRTLAKQTRNANFREKILRLAEEVEGGTSLSKALSLYPKLFSTFYVSMVKSGEASGKLSDIFMYLADHSERDYQFKGKIKGAMIYPIFVLVVFVVIGTIMAVYVLPQMMTILEESGQTLPLASRIVLAVFNFLKTAWWLLLLILIGLIVSIWQFRKTKTGKNFFDRNLLKIPLVSSFLKKIYLSSFALNLSTLISGGLPIAQALEITGDIVNNEVYKEIISKTGEEVKKGSPISSVLERYPKDISPFFYQMVIVGEKTGTLDSSLLNVVEFYQTDVDRSLDNFIKLLEPLFIIFLGLIVAVMVVAVIMPLYNYTSGF